MHYLVLFSVFLLTACGHEALLDQEADVPVKEVQEEKVVEQVVEKEKKVKEKMKEEVKEEAVEAMGDKKESDKKKGEESKKMVVESDVEDGEENNVDTKVVEKNGKEPVEEVGSEDEEDTEDSVEATEDPQAEAEPVGTYVDAYSDASVASAAINEGNPVVLFFYAEWCGTCKKQHTDLQAMYGEGGLVLTTYRVDYESKNALITDWKAKYKITQQHTFVLVNPGGEDKVLVGPTNAELKKLLKS